MLTYARLARDPSLFRTFTLLKAPEFDSIHKKVVSRCPESEERRLSGPDRKKWVGEGGRLFKLSLEDRLLMLMVYYRLHVTPALTHFLFDLDQSNVYRDIRYLEPPVRGCIPIPKNVHRLTKRLRTIEEV